MVTWNIFPLLVISKIKNQLKKNSNFPNLWNLKKKKNIGFIFGLKREMKLVSCKNNQIVCVCGYGKKAYNASKSLIKFGVDIVINFGFAGSIDTEI